MPKDECVIKGFIRRELTDKIFCTLKNLKKVRVTISESTMDSIKKKMQSLANETASAVMRFEKWEKELNRINENADSLEEQVIRLIKALCRNADANLFEFTNAPV